MKITDVKVFKRDKEDSKLKALASVTLDDCFVIHGIKVIQDDEKLFLSMPSRKVSNGEFKDTVHPLNTETRKYFEETVLAAYEKSKDEVEEAE